MEYTQEAMEEWDPQQLLDFSYTKKVNEAFEMKHEVDNRQQEALSEIEGDTESAMSGLSDDE